MEENKIPDYYSMVKDFCQTIQKECKSYTGDQDTEGLTVNNYLYYRATEHELIHILKENSDLVHILFVKGTNNAKLVFEMVLNNFMLNPDIIPQSRAGEFIVVAYKKIPKPKPDATAE